MGDCSQGTNDMQDFFIRSRKVIESIESCDGEWNGESEKMIVVKPREWKEWLNP